MKRLTITSLVLAATAVVIVVYHFRQPVIEQAQVTPDVDQTLPVPIPFPYHQTVDVIEVRQQQGLEDSNKPAPVENLEFTETDVVPKKPYEFWHDAQEILRASYRAEDLVVAAIYDQVVNTDFGGNNIELAEDSLYRAYLIEHDNPLVNHQIMTLCSRKPESTLCTLPYVENLRKVDEDNAALLNELSVFYYQNFDFNQALYLLNKAAVVEKSDNYYGRYIQAIDNALTFNRIRFLHTRQNLNLYPKLAAASINANFSSIIKMCDERVGLQIEQWRISCRDAGKNIADNSTNTLGEGYGVRQYVRYAGINLNDQQNAIAAVSNLREKVVGDMQDDLNVSKLVIPNRVWEAFIVDLRDKGEAQAYANLEEKMEAFRYRYRLN